MKVKLKIRGGKVYMETLETKGAECVDVANKLAELLGKKTDQKLKPQYYTDQEVITNKS